MSSTEYKTKRKILELLKWKGEATQDELAQELGISPMAVCKHLKAFQNEKIVTYKEKKIKRGRPTKSWVTTKLANQYFPNTHANLSISILSAVKDSLGEDALRKVFDEQAMKQANAYVKAIKDSLKIREKLHLFSQLRTEDGYMSEVQEIDKKTFMLIENHCPVCFAAESCSQLCHSELEMFKKVLGNDVDIERIEHMTDNNRRCAYKIKVS